MLSVDRAGRGIPLVFVHAFPLSKKMWEINKPAFSRNFQFISIDLPGFGSSPVSSESHSMEYMADQIIETLDSIRVKDKAVFTGVSMGGYVLFQLIKKYPDRFRGLALVSTRSKPDTEEAKKGRMNAVDLVQSGKRDQFADGLMKKLLGETTHSEKHQLVSDVKSEVSGAPEKGITAALKGMAARPDSTPLLSSISVPTVVISGDEDKIVSQQEMKEMAEHIPQSRFELVAKAGHLLTMESPDDFQSKFLHYLKRQVL